MHIWKDVFPPKREDICAFLDLLTNSLTTNVFRSFFLFSCLSAWALQWSFATFATCYRANDWGLWSQCFTVHKCIEQTHRVVIICVFLCLFNLDGMFHLQTAITAGRLIVWVRLIESVSESVCVCLCVWGFFFSFAVSLHAGVYTNIQVFVYLLNNKCIFIYHYILYVYLYNHYRATWHCVHLCALWMCAVHQATHIAVPNHWLGCWWWHMSSWPW